MVEAVDVAQQPVDVVLLAGSPVARRCGAVPIRGDGLLVVAAQDLGFGVARGHTHSLCASRSEKPGPRARLKIRRGASVVVLLVAAGRGVPLPASAHPGPGLQEE